MGNDLALSIVIPTYQRGNIVLDTIGHLMRLSHRSAEILIVDQTESHPQDVASQLQELHDAGEIVWCKLSKPSIPEAMNFGLTRAHGREVLFLDDDIVPDDALVQRHREAQREAALVAGQVLQPGQKTEVLRQCESFRFNSSEPAWIAEFMGGNFSVDRQKAISLGGFDENFVGAAYRFEAEFAHRFIQSFGPIRYEPRAMIHHLAVSSGGTRAHGHHLRTSQPSHSVGAYYYLLKTRVPGWWRDALWRPVRAIRTRHHLRRPWWIPLTLLAELRGFMLAWRLLARGPRLVQPDAELARGER
jgi:GT2 family glycosyltransferase